MLIEKDARRHILQAIKCEQDMKYFETKERLKGRIVIRTPQYDLLRKRFVEICNQINSVANTQGKGRDDLGINILVAAEEVSRKITNYKSKAVRKLSEQIKSTFSGLRALFRKYAENIEAVDPQLKNNPDLSDALLAFEKAWEKGKDFLLNSAANETLLSMSELIEGLAEKHKEVQEKIEAVDADIFIIIPCLAILKAVEEDDPKLYSMYYYEVAGKHTEIYEEIKRTYSQLKQQTEGYELYNLLERMILEKQVDEAIFKAEQMEKLLHEIKKLAIMLQRSKPSEWNSLMETAMGII